MAPVFALLGISSLAVGGAALALRKPRVPKVTTVRVSALDLKFKLSRTSVPLGAVRFVVTNLDDEKHNFAIAGKQTRVLAPRGQAALQVTFKKAGRYPYRCTVDGHAAEGMHGLLQVGKGGPIIAPPAPPAPPPPTTPPTPEPPPLQLTQIGTFTGPVDVTAPPGDPSRVFVVEHGGTIRVADNGVVQKTPFLDLSKAVIEDDESGLLGLAFAPDYATSGIFYVDYNAREGNGNIHVTEYHRSADPDIADPDSARTVLTIFKPYSNHNGGMLQFGPDGDLYISVGDGDSGVYNPMGAFAQTLDDLLSNILRIDPRQSSNQAYTVPASNPFAGVSGARPEIWSYGLRNPWRFWIDEATGNMYIGDVGEGTREEIDVEPAGMGGLNFGWPCFEGTLPFNATATCPDAVPPAYEYDHSPIECAVIAGIVMHDPRLAALDGVLLYSDLCDGKVLGLHIRDGKLTDPTDLGIKLSSPTSFGKDGLGRAYVASVDGAVYRIDPR
jgi:glucose/arabinose dehydrogenase/plastocyanin